MQAMQTAYASQGLTVVAVDVDRDRADAERFLHQFNPSFDIRYDPAGVLAESFHVKGMPTSVIIDRHGVPRYTHTGFLPIDRAAYEKQLQEVLAKK